MSETPNHNPAQEEEPAQVPPQTPPQESQEAQPVQGAEGPQDPSLPYPLLLTTEVSASLKPCCARACCTSASAPDWPCS